jgi:hypothetical protein
MWEVPPHSLRKGRRDFSFLPISRQERQKNDYRLMLTVIDMETIDFNDILESYVLCQNIQCPKISPSSNEMEKSQGLGLGKISRA